MYLGKREWVIGFMERRFPFYYLFKCVGIVFICFPESKVEIIVCEVLNVIVVGTLDAASGV